MPYVFVRDYSQELFDLNDKMYHVIIESHKKVGGERKLKRIRQSDRSLPLTLLDDFSEMGHLNSDTEIRDIRLLEEQISRISTISQSGANVCVPLNPLTSELEYLGRLSPKVAAYVLKRLGSVGMTL
jgi:hypothetical protein